MSLMAPTAWTGARSNTRGRRQRGSTLVEQALILPVMLAIFFGVIDMGRALYSYSFVSYVAREATRWASVRSGTGFYPKASQPDVTNFVKGAAGAGIDPANISAATTWKAPANGSPACPGGPANEKPGCIVQVTVTYNFKFVLPFLPTGTFVMSSNSEMIITQ
jgi:Flp pilus assembly protein TadG